MQSLTKDAEAKIQRAIEQLCHASNGDSCEQLKEAAVKIAREHQFEPDMIRLMSLGYNNGMATYQRESNDSVLEKLAEFPLLNADEVISDVFLRRDKQAFAGVSNEYDAPPSNALSPEALRRESLRALPLTKLAAEFEQPTLEDEEDGELGDGDAIRLLGGAQRLKNEIKEARARYHAAYDDLRDAVVSVRDYFKRASCDRDWSFGNVEFAVAHRYGETGQDVMDLIKQASGHTVSTVAPPKKPVNWAAAPFAQLGACVKLAREVVQLHKAYVNTAIDNRCKIAEMMQRFRRPAKSAEAAPADPYVLRKQAVTPSAVNFAVVAGALKNLMGSSLQPPSRPALVQSTLSDLQDPDHEEELRRIRSQTMLQQFLTDDPVLSGHEPDRVMNVFNELSSLSPRTAQQPAAARSILRKWVTQGAIEPFETREITDLERNLGDIQGGAPKPPAAPEKEKVANVLSNRSRLAIG